MGQLLRCISLQATNPFDCQFRGRGRCIRTFHTSGTGFCIDERNGFTGERVSCVGANCNSITIIFVKAGEDIAMRVKSFCQQGPGAICILSATGVISNATVRQPNSSGGKLVYEGRCDILHLTGSFMQSETGGMRNISGAMSVSLADPRGRVTGGVIAGQLIAASPVQIVLHRFLAGNQHEQTTSSSA